MDRFKAEGRQINMEVIFKFPDKSTFVVCSQQKYIFHSKLLNIISRMRNEKFLVFISFQLKFFSIMIKSIFFFKEEMALSKKKPFNEDGDII